MDEADNLTTFACRMSWKSGSLNLVEPSGPHRACYGTALPFIYICIHSSRYVRNVIVVLTAKVARCISKFYFVLISGVCITTDVDTLLYHMNNARYLRELDFARVDFYERTGLYKKIRQKGGAVVQGACTIRYRRFVRPFSVFKITSKVKENHDQISQLLRCKGLTENVFKNTQSTCRSYDLPPYHLRSSAHQNGNHRNQEN